MDTDSLLNIASKDPSLTSAQKKELEDEKAKNRLEKLLTGASGAIVGAAVSKYLGMSKPAQVILAALGFGAGRVVYDFYHRDRFSNYNEDTGSYEIDTKRF